MSTPCRNLGTAKKAAEIAGVAPSTIRNWLNKGLIEAIRVGSGPFQYDLDQVAAMVVEYPCPALDERIREIVDAAPEFTPQQVNQLRLLLHVGAMSEGGDDRATS